MRYLAPLFLSLVMIWPLAAQDPAIVLLERLDQQEVWQSSHVQGSIRVTDRRGTRETTFESWSSGQDRTMVRFTSGESAGQVVLRLPSAMYVAWPEADKPVKLQGAALRDAVAGSDLSYEDMAGERGYLARYKPTLTGRETIAGKPCVILELEARQGGLAWPYLRLWVEENPVRVLKVEKYSLNRRLLKTEEVRAFMTLGQRQVPSEILVRDQIRQRGETVFRIASLEIDIPIPDSRFSLGELAW